MIQQKILIETLDSYVDDEVIKLEYFNLSDLPQNIFQELNLHLVNNNFDFLYEVSAFLLMKYSHIINKKIEEPSSSKVLETYKVLTLTLLLERFKRKSDILKSSKDEMYVEKYFCESVFDSEKRTVIKLACAKRVKEFLETIYNSSSLVMNIGVV